MQKDNEEVFIEFDNQCVRVFTDLYDKFSIAVKKLDRNQNENVFQKLSSQYVFTLKEKLGQIALTIIEKYRYENNGMLERLTIKIDAYITEFSRKCRYD